MKKLSNPLSFVLFLPICSLLAEGTGTDYPYKTLVAEGTQLESYYVKADQSSEIAQTRFQRGLYLMSELSALRAKSQFEKADVSIDAYVSRVAGSNLKGVLPWSRKKYKQQLMNKALELRLLLSGQEEDLQALLKEIEKQLARVDMVSVKRTLERIDELIQMLESTLPNASPEKKREIDEVLSLLRETKKSIVQGIDDETDVSDLVESAAKIIDGFGSSGLVPNTLQDGRGQGGDFGLNGEVARFHEAKLIPHGRSHGGSAGVDPGARGVDLGDLANGAATSLRFATSDGAPLANQFPGSHASQTPKAENGLRYIGGSDGRQPMVQLPNGRKIRVSRPPQDWPNGRATGHDSIYDDRPGGNLIKEEAIVFERSSGSSGFEIKQLENSKRSRKWNFRIKESGGFEDRYSLTDLWGEVDFDVVSWTLRDSQRQIIERLDGNNLHFDPANLSEGNYSIEVAGVTSWQSPFTVVASVLR